MPRSWLVERVPRLWALWAASRPSQLALIVLLYAMGVGMTTSGPPLATGALLADAFGLLLVGLVAGVAYSLPPIALVGRGVGEPVNVVLGGLLLPTYGVAVLSMPTVAAWLAVVPFALAHLVPVPFLLWGGVTLTRQRSPLPAVAAMVSLAVAATVAWWWVGLGPL